MLKTWLSDNYSSFKSPNAETWAIKVINALSSELKIALEGKARLESRVEMLEQKMARMSSHCQQ